MRHVVIAITHWYTVRFGTNGDVCFKLLLKLSTIYFFKKNQDEKKSLKSSDLTSIELNET